MGVYLWTGPWLLDAWCLRAIASRLSSSTRCSRACKCCARVLRTASCPASLAGCNNEKEALMSIAPEEFLAYINGAFDGMVQIVETLGDERVNLRPNNMPNTNSPFAILTHCVGLTRYWIGAVLAGRQMQRDRDAEFRAQGTVAEIRQAVRELQQQIQEDLKH